MPFRNTGFDAQDIAGLQKVLDEACQQMEEHGRAPDEAARTRLAKRLIQLAEKGERDPGMLMLYLLGERF